MVVVTPAGEVIRTRSAVRKSSTGLDLNQLYLGAEGTLGVIAELTLRLFPVPTARAGTVLRFRSVGDASSAVLALLAAAPPTLLRCELLNAEAVTATNLVYRSSFQPAPTLFIECAGTLPSDVRRDAGAAAAIAQRCGCTEIPAGLTEGAALDELWELRRGCYPAAMAYRAATGAAPAGGKPDCVLITDVCVPLPELPAMIAATEADFETHGLLCVICAHIADGNFHALVPYSTPAEAAACHEAEARLIERAIAVGGTVSGEHGVGMGKIEHCLREHGREHLRVQASIKAALDPHGIMNPGKVYLGDAPLPCAKL
jgi:D-lactate dehydrogenase (cytochrome)